MTRQRPSKLPAYDEVDLAPFIGPLTVAIAALQARADVLANRLELTSAEDAQEAAERLEELRRWCGWTAGE